MVMPMSEAIKEREQTGEHRGHCKRPTACQGRDVEGLEKPSEQGQTTASHH